MGQTDCIFCRIASRDQDTPLVHEDADTVAFRDINPQAPTHVLIIPRRHIASVNALDADDAELIGKLYLAGRRIAHEGKIDESGYRLVMNSGPDAGQSVDHIHLHLLGGRPLGWPPG
ncbi:MAG: histidine triad nucleotide-binding protein [Longimicrobiales bacterium]